VNKGIDDQSPPSRGTYHERVTEINRLESCRVRTILLLHLEYAYTNGNDARAVSLIDDALLEHHIYATEIDLINIAVTLASYPEYYEEAEAYLQKTTKRAVSQIDVASYYYLFGQKTRKQAIDSLSKRR